MRAAAVAAMEALRAGWIGLPFTDQQLARETYLTSLTIEAEARREPHFERRVLMRRLQAQRQPLARQTARPEP